MSSTAANVFCRNVFLNLLLKSNLLTTYVENKLILSKSLEKLFYHHLFKYLLFVISSVATLRILNKLIILLTTIVSKNLHTKIQCNFIAILILFYLIF